MKQFKLLILFLVIGFIAEAQVNYLPNRSRNIWIAGKFDSTLHIPSGTTTSLRTGGYDYRGAVFYRTSDSTVYVYTGTQWISVKGAGGSSDSTIFATLYRVDTAKTNIRTTLDTKIDSMRRVGLNVQAYKNGTWITQFTDSVGTGGGVSDTSVFIIDTLYNRLAHVINTDSMRLKSILIQQGGVDVTPTVTDSTISWDITGVSGGSTGIRFDSSYTPMGGSRGADSFVVKSIRIRRNNITITPTQTGDSAMYWNIDVPNIADSTAALRARYDSAHYNIDLLNDSTVVFVSFNGQRDTLQFNAGTSPGTDTTSLSDRINLKLNISDTASMLNPYLRKSDTTSMLSPYTRVQRFLDSLSAHTTRFNGVTSSLATKVNISDTATMLNTYVQGVGTANYYPRFNSSRKIVNGVIYQFPSSGNIGINTIVDSAYKLNVNGSTWINGITDITPGTNGYLKVSNSGATAGVVLTNPSIPYMLFDIGGSASRSFGMFNSSGDMAIQQSQTWSGVNYHVFYGNGSYSNLGSASIGSHTLDSSAVLILQSTTKGFLAPRLTTTQRNAIASPSFGLMIYNTTDSAYQYYRASGWTGMGSGGSTTYKIGTYNSQTINGDGASIVADSIYMQEFSAESPGLVPAGGSGTTYLRGDGTWQTVSGGSPAGNFNNVQLNRNGAFAAAGSDSLSMSSGVLVSKGGYTSGDKMVFNGSTKNIEFGTGSNPSIAVTASAMIFRTVNAASYVDLTGGAYSANGSLSTTTKINVTTGTNKSAGTGTLASGTATISTTQVTANSLIFIQYTSCSSCASTYISAKTAGTSFVVTSTNGSDASTFNWWIIN
jgi:hypothetical protein